MTNDLELTLAAIVGGVALVVAVPLVIRLWRNELPWMGQPIGPRSHPATDRAYARVMPVGVLGLGIVTFGVICRLLIPGDVGLWCAVASFAVSAVLVVPMALIVLINRPRALVPPHLRNHPGFVRERRPEPDRP